MTIVVTGARGQIGRRVVERLVRAGASVRAVTRRPAQAAVPPDGVEVVRGDLTEPASLEAALRGAERLYLLLEDGHEGRAYPLNGPQFLTHREQVRLIGEALGRRIGFERVAPERAREIYLRQGGFAAENADFLLGFEDYSGAPADPSEREEIDLSAYGPLPTAQEVTGRPARTFAQWARDHADDFRP